MQNFKWFDVVLVDPRGIIGNGDSDTQTRQENYQRCYENLSGRNYMVITASRDDAESREQNDDFLYLGRSSRFSIPYLFRSVKFLKKKYSNEEILLTCSDPWESFLSAWIISKFIKARIQIQIHADIGDSAWRNLSLINSTRARVAKFTINRANKIRLVDEGQLKRLDQYLNFKLSKSKVDIVPVPLNLPNNFEIPLKKFSHNKSKRIGFVGRMHRDRGVQLFLRHIIELNSSFQDFEIVLIGDGEEKSQLISILTEKLGAGRVTDLGFLQGDNYYAALSSLDLVMSLASTESYGRVVRESLAFGVPILAKKNPAIDKLMGENHGIGIQIIDDNETGASISNKVRLDYLESDLINIGARIRRLEKESFENVVRAWKIHG